MKFKREAIDNIINKLNDPVMVIRIFLTLIAVNFTGFLFFAGINPLNFLNPLRFLDAPPVDSRAEAKLYFPKDSFLFSIDSEKEYELKDLVMESRQKFFLEEIPQSGTDAEKKAAIIRNVRLIIEELILGPADMKLVRLTREKHLVKNIWLQDGNLILHFNTSAMVNLDDKKQKLLFYAVERSLYENLPQIKNIRIVL